MQTECLYLLQTLARELENLKSFAAEASQKALDIKKTSGVAHHKLDLGETRKWVLGDVKEYGRILTDVQADVRALKEQRVLLRKSLRDLESNMLKAGTRKEEIVRFNRAKTDAGFAKMLKVRTLGPEYLETQSQLRRDIRAMRESVQKLEDHLQMSKKRLNEFKTGKPSLSRAPSLDTVSRTFRNIDIAIEQQKREMNKLRIRMSKLDTLSLNGMTALDKRLSWSSSKRPSNVTPNVAATTAAALNAERSAQKLKRVLLAVRTEPLLNTKASETHALTSFQTPQKAPAASEPADGLLSLPTTPLLHFPSSMPAWSPQTLPSEFGDSTSLGTPPSRGRGGTKHHQKPVALKKALPAAATSAEFAPPADFAWKPLQPMKPISTLPFSIAPKDR
ncbi:hypothetical protein F5I97DRAFT_1812802 [Phlebopus sp. FC_14]|nr:hypothetical protein F5I97DRAFT_1812802 [Phlebopus sp. FC_14]